MNTAEKPLIVATYCRVSTSEQTLLPQQIELRDHAARRGLTISHELSDVISGSKASRPGLDRLLELVRQREIDAILVVKIDRLARSLPHFASMITEFKRYDVALIAPGQGIDTTTSSPTAKFQLSVLAAVAELDLDFIRERVRAGLVAARARGKILGHPSTCLKPDWPTIVADFKLNPVSYTELAFRLGGVSRSTAWRLANAA